MFVENFAISILFRVAVRFLLRGSHLTQISDTCSLILQMKLIVDLIGHFIHHLPQFSQSVDFGCFLLWGLHGDFIVDVGTVGVVYEVCG